MPNSATGNTEWEVVEVKVGFDGSSGREAALDCFVEVVSEFESLDVVTIRVPRERTSELAAHTAVHYVEENERAFTLDD
ncbi:hypothetical protein [Haladaptatus sp. NG-WS-4]